MTTTFANLLRQAREEAGLTQKELAEVVGIDDSYISRIERGSPPPARDKVLAIAEALGINKRAERTYFLLSAGCANIEDLESIAQEEEAKETVGIDNGQAGAKGEEVELPLLFANQALHFPNPKRIQEEALIEELRALLRAAAIRTDRWDEIVDLLRSFFAWVRFRLGDKK